MKPGHLGGVMVTVLLAIGPKVRGLKSGQGSGFFKGDTNSKHVFLRMGSKAASPMS
jgi:hypothetical protein